LFERGHAAEPFQTPELPANFAATGLQCAGAGWNQAEDLELLHPPEDPTQPAVSAGEVYSMLLQQSEEGVVSTLGPYTDTL
jgi:hypothetical protein